MGVGGVRGVQPDLWRQQCACCSCRGPQSFLIPAQREKKEAIISSASEFVNESGLHSTFHQQTSV